MFFFVKQHTLFLVLVLVISAAEVANPHNVCTLEFSWCQVDEIIV